MLGLSCSSGRARELAMVFPCRLNVVGVRLLTSYAAGEVDDFITDFDAGSPLAAIGGANALEAACRETVSVPPVLLTGGEPKINPLVVSAIGIFVVDIAQWPIARDNVPSQPVRLVAQSIDHDADVSGSLRRASNRPGWPDASAHDLPTQQSGQWFVCHDRPQRLGGHRRRTKASTCSFLGQFISRIQSRKGIDGKSSARAGRSVASLSRLAMTLRRPSNPVNLQVKA